MINRQIAFDEVKKIVSKNPQAMLKNHNYGEMTPIDSSGFSEIFGSQVILTNEVFEFLSAVQEVTSLEEKEFPFFLYGKEIDENIILFDDYYSQSSERTTTTANFSTAMIDDLTEKIKQPGIIVCHGHSHPEKGSFYQDFSLGDLTSYLQMTENKPFKQREAFLLGGLVADNQLKFLFYDQDANEFYRFANILVRDKQGGLKNGAKLNVNAKKKR